MLSSSNNTQQHVCLSTGICACGLDDIAKAWWRRTDEAVISIIFFPFVLCLLVCLLDLSGTGEAATVYPVPVVRPCTEVCLRRGVVVGRACSPSTHCFAPTHLQVRRLICGCIHHLTMLSISSPLPLPQPNLFPFPPIFLFSCWAIDPPVGTNYYNAVRILRRFIVIINTRPCNFAPCLTRTDDSLSLLLPVRLYGS